MLSKKLLFLFLSSACEKYSFHVVRYTLILYMIKQIFLSDNQAYTINGTMLVIVFLCPIIGGWIADKFANSYQVCSSGFIMLFFGLVILVFPSIETLYLGLSFISVGEGYLRATFPGLVSILKGPHESKSSSDAKYTLFYVFVNLGAFCSTFTSCMLGEIFGWEYGFLVAAGVTILGQVLLVKACTDNFKGSKYGINLKVLLFSTVVSVIFAFVVQFEHLAQSILFLAIVLSFYLIVYIFKDDLKRNSLWRFLLCLMVLVIFFSLYEQGSTSINLFIDRNVDRALPIDTGSSFWTFFFPLSVIPVTLFQGIDPFVNVSLGLVLYYLWKKSQNAGEITIKYSLAFTTISLCYLIIWASQFLANNQFLVPPWLMIPVYVFLVCGELLVVPITMSAISRLSPQKYIGITMGVYNVGIAAGQLGASQLAKLTSIEDFAKTSKLSLDIYCETFFMFFSGGAIIALSMFILYLYTRSGLVLKFFTNPQSKFMSFPFLFFRNKMFAR